MAIPGRVSAVPYAAGGIRCPWCDAAVTLAIDRYGSCVQHGGCPHLVSRERFDGKMYVGFAERG